MGPDRSYDGNGVDFGRSQNLGRIANDFYVGICLPSACARRRRLIANSLDVALFQAVEVTNNIRPPIPVPNYTKLNHSCTFPICYRTGLVVGEETFRENGGRGTGRAECLGQ